MQVLGPVYVLGIIGFYFSPKGNRKQFMLFYCLILALVAFSFQPGMDDDLRREYQNLRDIQQYGWQYFGMKANEWDVAAKFDGLYLSQLYYYIMSYLPIYNLFPAITTFIIYLIQFILVEKVSKRYNLSKTETWVLYCFVLCTRETYMIISGIRNQLAFTVFGYFLYIDLIEKKKRLKCYFVYLLTVLIHQSVLFLITFRLLCMIRNKVLRWIIAGVLVCWTGMLEILNTILGRFASSEVIVTLIYKINIYTVNNGGNASNVILTTKYLLYMIAWIPIIILLIGTVVLLRKNVFGIEYKGYESYKSIEITKTKLIIRKVGSVNVSEQDASDISWYLIFNICFIIGSYIYYWIYLRSCITLGIIGIIPCSIIFYRNRNKNISSKGYILVAAVLCLIKLMIIMLVMNRSMTFDLLGIFTASNI